MAQPAVVFGLAGLGGLLIWSGVADPVGGPIGAVGAFVQGKTVARRVHRSSSVQGMGSTVGGLVGTVSGIVNGSSPPTGPAVPPGGLDRGSSFGGEVLATGAKYLGRPYLWGATGPARFDCSGLTQRVYREAVGIKLPRVSAAQALTGRPTATPYPGDLVFFGRPVHHVGIYVGTDQLLHAPHTGDVVRYASISGTRLKTDPAPVYRTWQ